jgi:hypothetical protein
MTKHSVLGGRGELRLFDPTNHGRRVGGGRLHLSCC